MKTRRGANDWLADVPLSERVKWLETAARKWDEHLREIDQLNWERLRIHVEKRMAWLKVNNPDMYDLLNQVIE